MHNPDAAANDGLVGVLAEASGLDDELQLGASAKGFNWGKKMTMHFLDSSVAAFRRDPRRNEALDALRGIAVGLVMLRHAWPNVFPAAGIVGVAIFFTLSGYLITRVIHRELIGDATRGFRWKRFYAHRAFRLYPALVLLVLVFLVVELVWDPTATKDGVWTSVVIAITYTADLPLADGLSASIGHLWSLAIEEQFYLLWPALLVMAQAWKRDISKLSLLLGLGLTVICLTTLALTNDPGSLYESPTTWASCMAFGGVAYFYKDSKFTPSGDLLRRLSFVAVAVLAAASLFPDAKESALTYAVGPTLIAVCTITIVLQAERRIVLPTALRPLVWLGVISYGVYLWNLPLTIWWRAALGDPPGWTLAATIPLSIIAALISWFTVEGAARSWRKRFDAASMKKPATASAGRHIQS
ncbi:acyltransferase family protein [Paenarthrobacter nitroguajacolicus]|uniref:acyltransferase family protein n=1 Tax=Paenarthrobacter nitroguajacolicus TaxID=211146 RepID=UPI003427851B